MRTSCIKDTQAYKKKKSVCVCVFLCTRISYTSLA